MRIWRDPVVGIAFVWVPGGCYRMGSGGGYANERFVHKVCVDGFWMGRYPITQGEWQRRMGDNPSRFTLGENNPVEQVSWDDVQAFIGRMNEGTVHRFRLPTEAEWEFACRSRGQAEKYAGGDRPEPVAWFGEPWADGHRPVGGKAANGAGLYDMCGQVWEWVQDTYDTHAYQRHALRNPLHQDSGPLRVVRGGCWNEQSPGEVRCTVRRGIAAGLKSSIVGFRLIVQPRAGGKKEPPE